MIRLPLICTFTLFLGVGSISSVTYAADTTSMEAATANSTLTKDDAEFVRMALLGGMSEIRTSELAIKRGLTGADLAVAKQMVEFHTSVNRELAGIAKDKGVAVPTALDEKMQKKLDELGKKNDKDFRQAYFDCQVDAHKQAVSAFKSASADAKDVDVKAFATKHLAHLQAHLDKAKEIEDKN